MDWLKPAESKARSGDAVRADRAPWVLLIVDDEQSIHDVTTMVLRDFEFQGRGLEFLHAYSGAEAVETIRSRPDVAVILMDVVMETDDAGLRAVDAIRSKLENHLARIILRTGHPGQAPENQIITHYDIDDYKEKTELTNKKLFTSVYVAVRSFRDLQSLARNREGLEHVIQASTHLLGMRGISEFAHGVLTQLSTLLHAKNDAFLVHDHGLASLGDVLDPPVIAATGKFESASSLKDIAAMDNVARTDLERLLESDGALFGEGWFCHCIRSPVQGRRLAFYLESDLPWTTLDRRVLELFSHNVAMGLDNLLLNNQVLETQRRLVLMLGEAIEMRSLEAGQHVHRVAEYSALLAQLVGLDPEEVETLKMAAPLHDVGKIAIEDAILNKPGRHTPQESERMREHAQIGADILDGHRLPVLEAACQIAVGHHENWDGSGYPSGAAGEDVHIYGRIVALADVFDALRSERCYKQAWPLDKTLEFVRAQRGKKFDPQLVDLLLENIEDFVAIGERLAD